MGSRKIRLTTDGCNPHLEMSTFSLKLFCVVHPANSAFSVELGNDDTVDDLKTAIKLKNTCLDDINGHELTLYKVSILEKYVAQTLSTLLFDGSDDRVEELDAMEVLVDVFPNDVEKGHLHIVATRPGPCCLPSDPCDFTYGLTKRPMTWENVSICFRLPVSDSLSDHEYPA